MSAVLDIVSWACILAGSAIIVTGGIGLVRLPDFYTRGHAVGMTDTLGAALLVFGMMAEAGWSLNLARLAFILFVLLFTGPAASHALAHAALVTGLEPWRRGVERGSAPASDREEGD